MPRLLPLTAAALAAAVSLASISPMAGADAATKHHKAAKPKPEKLQIGANGYSSKITGGSLPIGSARLGHSALTCSVVPNKSDTNNTAGVTLPGGLGSVGAITGHDWSTKKGSTVNAYSEHKVASVTLAQLGVPNQLSVALKVTGIEGYSHAWHNSTGFHHSSSVTVAAIQLAITVAGKTQTQNFTLPKPGKTLRIGPSALTSTLTALPGLGALLGSTPIGTILKDLDKLPDLADIQVGPTTQFKAYHRHGVRVRGVVVSVPETKTKITLASAGAFLADHLTPSLVHGRASAVSVSVLGKTVGVDPQPDYILPCRGTGGKLVTESVAGIPLVLSKSIPGITIDGLTGGGSGTIAKTSSKGYSIGRVAHVDLAGQLVIDGIVGKVSGTYKKGKAIKLSTAGTTVGSITVAGKAYSLGALNGLEIPGLVSIKTNVVSKFKGGESVTALRLTLLNGSGAVVNLGNARFQISKTGVKK